MGVFPWTNYQYWYIFDLYDPNRVETQQNLKARALGPVRDIRGSTDQTTPPEPAMINSQWYVIKWLNGKTHMSFDIPTELMYEIAARAGAETPYFWGADASLAPQYAVYGRTGSRPGDGWDFVGTKKPNNWGLYDMVGLDWEWCLDSYVAGDDPATHTDVFIPYVSAGATDWRVRGGSANVTNVAGMNPSNRSGARSGSLNSAPSLYVFRVAYIVPNSGD